MKRAAPFNDQSVVCRWVTFSPGWLTLVVVGAQCHDQTGEKMNEDLEGGKKNVT
jgi:hypothetical protein